MTADLRSRVEVAIDLHVHYPDVGEPWVHGTLAHVVNSLLKALGTPETEWATVCDGLWFPTDETRARRRARIAYPKHVLKCRDIVAGGWHEPTDSDVDQAPVNRTTNERPNK